MHGVLPRTRGRLVRGSAHGCDAAIGEGRELQLGSTASRVGVGQPDDGMDDVEGFHRLVARDDLSVIATCGTHETGRLASKRLREISLERHRRLLLVPTHQKRVGTSLAQLLTHIEVDALGDVVELGVAFGPLTASDLILTGVSQFTWRNARTPPNWSKTSAKS